MRSWMVDIIRLSADVYSFVLVSAAEQLCVIELSRRIPEELYIWDELWGCRESGGFRPPGSGIDNLCTLKTVWVTRQEVEELRGLATKTVAK